MFNMFKRRGSGKQEMNEFNSPLYDFIAGKLVASQKRWADWMQRNFEKCSTNVKKVLLFLFIAVAGGFSAYFIAAGVFDYTSKPLISKKADFSKAFGKVDTNSVTDRQKVDRFNEYIRKLEKTPDGQKIRNEIISAHPGLLDSLEAFRHAKDSTSIGLNKQRHSKVDY